MKESRSTTRVDVLVLGAGVAGCWAALEGLERGRTVAIASKCHPLRSHSCAAQGGIAAPLGNVGEVADDAERMLTDMVKSSDWLGDIGAMRIVTGAAASTVIAYERMGCVFSRLDDGRIAQRPFAGHSAPRACYASDRTGHALLHTLFEQCKRRGARFLNEHMALTLASDGDGGIAGAVLWRLLDGAVVEVSANAVVLATGGHAGLYAVTTNGTTNTGDGCALALDSGGALMDMEMIQFHPTGLAGHGVLLSEACRAEGGVLRNRDGERFMRAVAPKAMELAPRDIVSRAEQVEIDEGRGSFDGKAVDLDLTHLPSDVIAKKLRQARALIHNLRGVDIASEPVPVAPTAHYSMGGIAIDADGRVLRADGGGTVSGLFAAGECTCVSVHGANRLGSASLLEASIFGRRAGTRAAEPRRARGSDLEEARRRVEARMSRWLEARTAGSEPEPVQAVQAALGKTMSESCGVFRNEDGLLTARAELAALGERLVKATVRDRSMSYNTDLQCALDLESQIVLASTIVESALRRTESRGAHYRADYPERDDDRWLVHQLTSVVQGEVKVSERPVDVDLVEHPPRKRSY